MSRPVFRGFAAVVALAFGAALVCTDQAASRTRHQDQTRGGTASGGPERGREEGGQAFASGELRRLGGVCRARRQVKDLLRPGDAEGAGSLRVEARPCLYLHFEPARRECAGGDLHHHGVSGEGGGRRAGRDRGGPGFDLVTKGTNAWIKNQAEEPQFVDALKKGSKLIVKAPSLKGNVTTDSYSLAGLSQALDRVEKECP